MSTACFLAFILWGVLQVAHCQNDTLTPAANGLKEGAPNATITPTDYCKTDLCPLMKKHIACKNKGVLSAMCAPGAKLANLTDLHDLILDEHNAFRNLLAGGKIENLPQPDRMATLQWHSELEELAALNVKQCLLKPDPCHNTLEFRNSGQNLALIRLKKLPGMENHTDECLVKEAMRIWWDQILNATTKNVQHFPQGKLGDPIRYFANMARDNNTFVGCAAVRYEKPIGDPYYLMACNYAGNAIPGYPIYREKAMGCQNGTDLKYPSLCKVGEVYEEPPVEATTVKTNFWRV
ncbi:antigen 5 like allergen Cul n 1 [Drosophila bipectinata]|uniref:antigen 5 like allergen Cul n 1 n=1 Tax=Drosophila bipectinata TaxID=42026 RepID=UPI001C89A078|nr:antigen 5 like allergen Cul n 1 [Drosophila bipectinata]